MNYRYYGRILAFLLVCATVCISCTCAENTRTITDMTGRTVTIPTVINSVLGTAPPTSEAVYMIKPDVLVGLNFAFNDTKYVSPKYASLPNVGGQQMGSKLNYETFQSMKPDIVLYGYTPGMDVSDTVTDIQTRLNPIPVVAVADSTNASNYGPEIKFLGELLDQTGQADALDQFYDDVYQKVNSTVAKIPDDQKKRVYYAEGPDGLKTDPADSAHAQLINVCGGKNVATVQQNGGGGMTPVSMEQVISWNPDLILAGDAGFYKKVLSDPQWKEITAVKNKQVYLIPNQPFGYIDRPPGVNRIIGIPWLAKVLYPDQFKDLDLASMLKEFYAKFYHYDLSDDDVKDIISSSGLKSNES